MNNINKIFQKHNFTIKQPADMVQNILNLIQNELKELVSQEDYDKSHQTISESEELLNSIK